MGEAHPTHAMAGVPVVVVFYVMTAQQRQWLRSTNVPLRSLTVYPLETESHVVATERVSALPVCGGCHKITCACCGEVCEIAEHVLSLSMTSRDPGISPAGLCL
jgi:hypothetical protein